LQKNDTKNNFINQALREIAVTKKPKKEIIIDQAALLTIQKD
jgi:hypothetical protein